MTGIERIAAERQRQIEVEGWTPEHDDRHAPGELATAALCYASIASLQLAGVPVDLDRIPNNGGICWPWSGKWWKPSPDPSRNIEKAGALLAAERDRLARVKEDRHDQD